MFINILENFIEPNTLTMQSENIIIYNYIIRQTETNTKDNIGVVIIMQWLCLVIQGFFFNKHIIICQNMGGAHLLAKSQILILLEMEHLSCFDSKLILIKYRKYEVTCVIDFLI